MIPEWERIYQMPQIVTLETAPATWATDIPAKAAAVLCLFLPGLSLGDPLRILFTRRSALVNSHRGQIGFPGGRREAVDASPVATALRETEEEIGISPKAVTIWGQLPPVKALDLNPVIPIVGSCTVEPDDCICNADEVACVFALPWTYFTAAARQTVAFNLFGRWRETAVYPAEGYNVWGLTAAMLTRAQLREASASTKANHQG